VYEHFGEGSDAVIQAVGERSKAFIRARVAGGYHL